MGLGTLDTGKFNELASSSAGQEAIKSA